MASQEQLNGGRPQLPWRDHVAEALPHMMRMYVPGLFDFWDFEVTQETQEIARYNNQVRISRELYRLPASLDESGSDKRA